ncbi:hypothetical protein LA080_004729 [Diaporthe eres]|nr:hypothetical protein LA080_004729 [Diaporthe eres]
MASICRSCTMFHDLARPRLYCNFESHVFTNDWHCFSVAKFAWTISKNSHLASLVRRVNIRGVCDMFPEPRVTGTDDPDHPMASVLINKAAELGMEFKYYKVYTNRHEEPRSGWPWTQSPVFCFSPLLVESCSTTTFQRKSAGKAIVPRQLWPIPGLSVREPVGALQTSSQIFLCAGGATACDIIEALEPAHSSLEVLGIDLRRWAGPWGLRIPTLEQFVALKVLYIDLICVWDWQAGNSTGSPPSPDMLFSTLLPESIEEVALFGMDFNAGAYGFEIEAHVKRLASDRKEKGRFPQLKQLHGQGFWPFGYDVDPRSVANDDIVPRVTALNDAKTLLKYNGVEVIFDVEGDSELEFGDIISFY